MEASRSLGVHPSVPTARSALLIVLALLASGCATHPGIQAPSSATAFGRETTLIYVTGIGGFGHPDRDWIDGLRAGGYRGHTQVWDWTGKMGPVSALWSHARQRSMARRIAQRVRQLRSKSPAAPIVLVGHSAGAGLAVGALENLPGGVRVDELVLLAPALSRTYNLSGALRHVGGRADVFYSKRDTLVLAIGTLVFGTVDGVHGEAAGHSGFIRPRGASAEAYSRLVAHPYSSERRLFGDDGGHEGVLASGMASSLIDPLLPGYGPQAGRIAQADIRELP